MAQPKRSWRAGRILGSLTLAYAATLSSTATASADEFRLIVSSANPTNEIAPTTVAQCYVGGYCRWSNGQPVVPIDQSTKSAVRKAFSQQVLQLDVEAVQVQWMRAIVAGKGRPPISASEADVIESVAKDPKMMGYVSADAALPPNVKTVAIRQ